MLWPSVSALRASNTVFSEFLPVLSPEMIVLVARAHVFLTEEHASEDRIARLQLVPSCSLPFPGHDPLSAPPALHAARFLRVSRLRPGCGFTPIKSLIEG